MSPNKHTITDSEYTIMKILWSSQEKRTVADVVKALDDQRWTPSTVSTFLQRLLKKDVVGCEKRGKRLKKIQDLVACWREVRCTKSRRSAVRPNFCRCITL